MGITEMFFLQQKDLTEEAQGRITLGPLECVETSEFTLISSLFDIFQNIDKSNLNCSQIPNGTW